MPTFKAPRGTRDILPAERATWTRLERAAAELAARYGYREIETPLFEQGEVFERGVGDVTDIVEKELFRIAPRTEEAEAWALRPEPTAGIAIPASIAPSDPSAGRLRPSPSGRPSPRPAPSPRFSPPP